MTRIRSRPASYSRRREKIREARSAEQEAGPSVFPFIISLPMVQELFGRAMTIFRDPTIGRHHPPGLCPTMPATAGRAGSGFVGGCARRAAFDVAGTASSIVRNGRCRPEKGEIPSGTGRRAPYSAACGFTRASASLVRLASVLISSSRFFSGRTDGKSAGSGERSRNTFMPFAAGTASRACRSH